MKLIIEDDEGRKTVVPIVREDVEITIGRQEGNTIRLTERNVSRRHAKLARKSGMVSIEDLGSYNGIKVNGDRIQGSFQLKEGDLVQIGDYDLAIQSEEQKAPVTSPPAAMAANAPTQQEMVAADAEATLQTEVPEGEENTSPSAPLPASSAAKKHDSTSVISSSQLRAAVKARKVVDIPPEEAPRLLLTTTDLAGREYACIRSELKIGRTDDNDIAIDHRSISRNHCKVVREDNGEWKVIDLQSANGVKVNGETYAESALKPGDVIELGHLRFKFLAPGEEAPSLEDSASGAATSAGSKKSMVMPLAVGVGFLVAAGGSLGGWYFLTHRNQTQISTNPEPIEPVKPDKTPDKTPDKVPDKPEPPKPDQPRVVNPDKPDKPEDPKTPDKPELPPVHPKVAKAFDEGKELLAKGDFAKAEKKLALAKDYGVDEAAPLLEKARAELEAEKTLAEAQRLFKGSDVAGARKAVDSIPADSVAATKSKALVAQIAAAEEKKAKADELAKAKMGNEKRAQAEELFNTGMGLFAEKKYKEAADFFQKAISTDPTHAKAHMYLGTCFAKTNRFDDGAAAYEEFVHLAPGDEMAAKVVTLLKGYYEKNPGRKPRYPLPQ